MKKVRLREEKGGQGYIYLVLSLNVGCGDARLTSQENLYYFLVAVIANGSKPSGLKQNECII